MPTWTVTYPDATSWQATATVSGTVNVSVSADDGETAGLTVSLQNTLSVNNATSASTADNITLAQQNNTLTINTAVSVTTSENVVLSPPGTLSVNNATSATYADTLTLSLSGISIKDIHGGAGGLVKMIDGSSGGIIKSYVNGAWQNI